MLEGINVGINRGLEFDIAPILCYNIVYIGYLMLRFSTPLTMLGLMQ
jgi:hypothetical protein